MTLQGFAHRLPTATLAPPEPRPIRPLPPCSWCGDHGFRWVTERVVLCLSDWEFVQLHRETGEGGAW